MYVGMYVVVSDGTNDKRGPHVLGVYSYNDKLLPLTTTIMIMVVVLHVTTIPTIDQPFTVVGQSIITLRVIALSIN